MRSQLEQRLAELQQEHQNGQRMLADLEAKQASLRETMLRISGAIQVLEELLSAGQQDGTDERHQGETQAAATDEIS